MANMNKVEVTFDADVNQFTRGVDKMERKLHEFDAKANKTEKNIGSRFDLMDKSVKKVEKSMEGLDSNADFDNFRNELNRVRLEFERTGKIGSDSFDRINKAGRKVDFTHMPKNVQKAFKPLTKDLTKLEKQFNDFNKIKFAKDLPRDMQVVGLSFKSVKDIFDKTEYSLYNMQKTMSKDQFKQYSKSVWEVKDALSKAENEMRVFGKVSKETTQDLDKSVSGINFAGMSRSATKEFAKIKRETTIMTNHFNNMNGVVRRSTKAFDFMGNNSKRVYKTMRNDWTRFVNTVNRLGTAFRNVGEIAGSAIKGGVLSSLSSIIPIAGAAVTSVMGIGAGLSAVGGAAIGLGGAYGVALGGIQLFVGQAKTALQMLEDKQIQITKEVQRYQSSLKGLQDQWKNIVKANQAQIFNTMTNGINMARNALTQLNPFITRTARQIEVASGKMYKWVTSSNNARAAFEMLNKRGPAIFQNVLNAGGHLGNGLTRIFVAFGPLFTWFGQGIESMSKQFDKWANSVSTQNGIKDFIEFTKRNMPILGSIFGNTFMGIIHLFKAFSGQTEWAMKGLEKMMINFNKWAQNLNQTDGFKSFIKYTRDNAPVVGQLIGNIVDMFVQFVKASAPIGSWVLEMITKFTGWTATMMKTHPMLSKILMSVISLAGAFKLAVIAVALLWTPLARLGGVFTLLAGRQTAATLTTKLFNGATLKQNGILGLAKGLWTTVIAKIKAFSLSQMMAGAKTKLLTMFIALQNGVNRVASGIWTLLTTRMRAFALATMLNLKTMKANILATKTWTIVSKIAAGTARALGLAIRFMTGPVGMIIMGITALVAIIIHLWKTNSTFRNGVIAIWNSIKNAAISVFGFLKPYILNIWNAIKSGTVAVWNAIKWVVTGVWNGIKGLFQKGGMKSAVTNVWTGIKNATFSIWNGIKNVVVGVATTIKNAIVISFRFAVNTAIGLWRKMANSSNPILRAFAAYIKLQFTIIKTVINAVMTFVKNVNKGGWSYIKTIAIKMVSVLVVGVKKLFGSVRAFILSTLMNIRAFSTKIWTGIKNIVLKLVRLYVNGVKRNFTLLRNFITSLFTKIKNFFVRTWTSIKNFVVKMAQSIWTNVRNKFNGLYKSIRSIFTNISKFSRKLWTALKNAITKTAQQLWNNLKSKFNGLYKTIRNIFNAVKSYMSRTWNTIKNYVTAKAREMWNNLRKKFTELKRGTINIFNSVKSSMTRIWKSISSVVTGIAKGIWSKVGGTFRKMRDGLKGIIGTIKSHIDGMVNKVKKGLNKLVDGVNWVAGKIGMDKLPKFKFSTGTTHTQTINRKVQTTSDGRLKQPTRAIVGDKGRGNGPGGFRNELIEYPNGKFALTPSKDTEVILPANSRVHNGTATYNALQQQNAPMPRFSTGTLPRFADGSFASNAGKFFGKVYSEGKEKKEQAKSAYKAGKKVVKKKTGEAVSYAADKASDAMAFGKDIYDWVSKPGKLVDNVLSKFGVNFDFAKGDIVGGLMKAAYKKLKNGVKDLFSSWLEDSGGGDGSSFMKFKETVGYSPNKPLPGYPYNGGRHWGRDYATPIGTPLLAPTKGTVSQQYDKGGGTVARLVNGKFAQYFLHLSKVLKTGPVKQGEKFALTGNSGDYTWGPHVHYQVEKGPTPRITNSNTIDPLDFLKGSGGGKYGSGSAAARKIIKRAQAIMGGKFKSSYVTEQMMRLAKRESNFDVNAINNWDSNAMAGNPSRGMFQMIKTTFDAFKTKGYNNYKNPVDQAVAVLNYINKKYTPFYGFNGAFKRSADRAYESGGFANFPQLAWLAEGGFSESIISHDPANKVKSKAIHDRTGELLNFNEEPELLRRLIALHEESNEHTELIEQHTRATASNGGNIEMNGKKVGEVVAPYVQQANNKKENIKQKFRGRKGVAY
ncbi:peptidoglycan DD-metalloendopeptidase family protein [Mammaliicoccus sciuri]|uniref:peptidoglycan DD-metalloendopeptidase family protein n=1 Tax=Mammaliicoccus sciuri TaxID=1296 RepID=UPI001D0D41DE|nr:peptidoglycan DD-metalloendopeptidase family protein [Mammaliicoccus sciuri]MCC2087882.1 peptidoglycan DD-metalloendopeptidase family protein [Mammaliicoccus sciuri]